MRHVSFVCTSAAALALLAGNAHAAEVRILGQDGQTTQRRDPGVAARDRTPAPPAGKARATHRRERSTRARANASARRRTVTRELGRLLDAGAIDQLTYDDRRAAYASFKRAVKRFEGRRRADMQGVLDAVDGIAARGALTASRLPALWLTMERNREWWNEGPLLASGARVSFEGSELVWQYVPGEGLHIHPLANFGKLNALWRTKGATGRLSSLMDELLALPAERAGGIAWEYYFDFGGGRPPWVSGLAQGTGLQAISRAAVKLGRAPDVLPRLRQGLGVFRTAPPEGVRTEVEGGVHYAQYSYAPGLQILNGFIQSLVGLHDFAVNAGDAEAQQLFLDGESRARIEVPTFDTGAWSLYSRGTVKRESDLNYHGVLRDFLESLCDRTAQPVYCDAVAHFNRYLQENPAVELITRRLRGGRRGTLRFRLSKISRVEVRLLRGSRSVYSMSGTLGYGTKRLRLPVPRRRGTYEVEITATDLAGNLVELSDTVDVLKPKARRA